MKLQSFHRSMVLITGIVLISSIGAFAQKNTPNTKSPMVYHGGQVIVGSANLYTIWYGCWTNSCGNNGSAGTKAILDDFAGNIGATPYFVINTGYPNNSGQTPSGVLLYGGSTTDPNYSRGTELTADDIKAIVAGKIDSGALPPDPVGIYVVIASADVGSTATGFCTVVGTPPLHGNALPAIGSFMHYGFIGNPNRCPAIGGPQFIGRNGERLPTPNGDFAADVMASDLAHLLNAVVTNPFPDISYLNDGWYDRYGLENADKCTGTFGTTFTTSNGARANVTWGARSYLVQQNWVNDKKGRCDMQLYHF